MIFKVEGDDLDPFQPFVLRENSPLRLRTSLSSYRKVNVCGILRRAIGAVSWYRASSSHHAFARQKLSRDGPFPWVSMSTSGRFRPRPPIFFPKHVNARSTTSGPIANESSASMSFLLDRRGGGYQTVVANAAANHDPRREHASSLTVTRSS